MLNRIASTDDIWLHSKLSKLKLLLIYSKFANSVINFNIYSMLFVARVLKLVSFVDYLFNVNRRN